MNDISTTRYVIIIIFRQNTLLIIGTINHWTLNRIWIYGKYFVVEKGFVAFKSSNINIVIVLVIIVKTSRKSGQYLPNIEHWDRLKVYFVMLQFLYWCIFVKCFCPVCIVKAD